MDSLLKPAQCPKAEASLHLQELASRSKRTFGLWGLIASCPTPLLPRLLALCEPCPLQQCTVCFRLPGAPGAPITDAGSLPFPWSVCSLFRLHTSLCLRGCLSIVEAGSSERKGAQLLLHPSHSSGFRLQRCWNSWPYSWIHLFATGMYKKTKVFLTSHFCANAFNEHSPDTNFLSGKWLLEATLPPNSFTAA